jgi:transposase
MERLEKKKINGKFYYYYSKWEWVDGKCKRVWQKYLGDLKSIVSAFDGNPEPLYAEVFQWGLTTALWSESINANIKQEIDDLCPKRNQGLTVGDYIVVAAINRAINPYSKRSMWEWFSKTSLIRYLPDASQPLLTSQRFWDHMDKIKPETALVIWKNILKRVIQRDIVDISKVSYDGTNFYTFIDTFNNRCDIAKRGKNKQGRHNLRQVSYALFCSQDGHIPLYYDVYQGNRNDAKQFPLMLDTFHEFLKELVGSECQKPQTTIIFDKGNNSRDNFALVDGCKLNYVGSVKLDEHKDLLSVVNTDSVFKSYDSPELEGTKAFRVLKTVYGKERIIVVTYNQRLFDCQWLTLQNDINKAVNKLSELKQKLDDRANGVIKQGNCPTLESVKKQSDAFLSRQHLKTVIVTEISKDPSGVPRLRFHIDSNALNNLETTYLGKTLIISNHEDWNDDQIITAYRSQFLIEDVFKEMKDRHTGSWWPLYHWTDSKIAIHAFYCSIALLIRATMHRWIQNAGLQISMKRTLSELDDIKEVITVYPRARRKKKQLAQTTLTKTNDLQENLIILLQLEKYKV